MKASHRLLLVDDDPLFLMVAEALLTTSGQTVVASASDGEQALAALRQAEMPITMIVLDLNMPNLDGLAFMREAAQAGYAGQILISSGESDAILRSAQRMGEMLGIRIAGTVKKPLQPANFLSIVELNAPRATDEAGGKPVPQYKPDRQAATRLVPYYQPQYLADPRAVVGFEALARIVAPDATVHGAGHLFSDGNDELKPISMAFVREVLADMSHWRVAGVECRVSVNLDARVIEDGDIASKLIEMVSHSGVPPRLICFELTETSLPKDISRLAEILIRLRMAGFELSLDDYGTGGSNFELLRLCPFSELKIDASIVRSAAREAHSQRFMEVAVAMASDLGMSVVAEGVETAAQLEMAARTGVRVFQGFLFSKAIPADQALELARFLPRPPE